MVRTHLRALGVLLALLALALSAGTALAAPPPGLHCPDGWTVKDESGADDNNLQLPAGTIFCVKAGSGQSNDTGTGNTGILTADGTTTLQEYLAAAGIVDGGGVFGRNVSYYVIYSSEATPTPTPTPTASETPTSTPEASETPAASEAPASTPRVITPMAPLPNTSVDDQREKGVLLPFLGLLLVAGGVVWAVMAIRKRRRA